MRHGGIKGEKNRAKENEGKKLMKKYRDERDAPKIVKKVKEIERGREREREIGKMREGYREKKR